MSTAKEYPKLETTSASSTHEVAEALASYGAPIETRRTTFKGRVEPSHIAGLTVSDEVWRFAEDNALVPHLETSIRLIRESFKNIQEIKLTYEIDPEIPNRESVAIHFYASGSFDELLQADRDCIRAFVSAVPNEFSDKINLLLWANPSEKNKSFGE